MSEDVRTIPAVRQVPEGHNERAARDESDRETARLQRELAARCSVFTKTGRHDLSDRQGPMFMCGSGCDVSYSWHCTGTARRSATFDGPCPEFRVEGERRGSRGRKTVLRPPRRADQ